VSKLVLLTPASPSPVLKTTVADVSADIAQLCGRVPTVATKVPSGAAYVLRLSENAIADLPLPAQAKRPQGYQTTTSPTGDVHAIILQGHDSAGTLYASQTLRQLLRADDQKRLLIPKVKVVDWPDLEDRGYFLYDVRESKNWDLEAWKRHVDWAAEQRFNPILFKAIDARGLRYPSRAFSEFIAKDSPLATPGQWCELMEYGRHRAVRLVPYIVHVGSWSYLFRDYPNVIMSLKGRKTYTTEEALVQAEAFYKAFETATASGHKCTLRVLTTGITLEHPDQMFHRLPPTVKVDYYDGMRTYTLRGIKFRKPAIKAMQDGGFHFSTMPSFGRTFWQSMPLFFPALTHKNVLASAKQRAQGLVANSGDQITAFAINYAAGAEFAWNLHGRTVPKFIQAWAQSQG